MFLRKQSRNSLANWWSVCFKMFFSNGFICGVASTGSATVYENYFYAQPPCMKIIFMLFCFIFETQRFLLLNCFLSELSWRNSFAMKLYGNCYLNRLFSITKFTESRWNDGVFECSEEHRRCSGKVTNFRLAGVEKLFPWWRDSSLLYASFRMTWFCFLLTIRNLFQWENYFWNAKIIYYSYVFKEAKWEFASELMKRVF